MEIQEYTMTLWKAQQKIVSYSTTTTTKKM